MANDRTFLQLFLDGAIDSRTFRHADHLRRAFELIQDHDFSTAAYKFSTALKVTASRGGNPEAYHETITLACGPSARRECRRDRQTADDRPRRNVRRRGFQPGAHLHRERQCRVRCDGAEDQIRSSLEERLRTYAGRPVGVIVRTASEMVGVVARNPFADSPGNRVSVLFVDSSMLGNPWEGVTGAGTEQIGLGERELFVLYPDGMAATRLRIPGEKLGTARNMNTVMKLAGMAAALA